MLLTLEDAIKVATQLGIDKDIAKNEFEQKCYVTDDQYSIGYAEGMDRCIRTLTRVRSGILE